MTTLKTVSAGEARQNFSRLGEEANKTGDSITVFKHSRPWLKLVPLAVEKEESNEETQQAIEETEAIFSDPNHVFLKDMSSALAELKKED